MITQSMLFPWLGLLEQVQLADVVVHYDDVQFSKGGRVNRIQIKTPEGMKWMTVPLAKLSLGQSIDEVQIDFARNWQDEHFSLLQRSFEGAPHSADAIEMARMIYDQGHQRIGALSRASFMAAVGYFGLDRDRRFVHANELAEDGASSNRVLRIVQSLGGADYITGHGARNYLDHEAFEAAGVRVSYMDYQLAPYPQLHGAFSPYVSCLDLIANCGRAGRSVIRSDTVEWRRFLDRPA
jgi:hypothetical protein